MDKWLKASIMAAVLLAGTGVFYYFAVVLPRIEQARLDRETALGRTELSRLAQRRSAIDSCREAARMVYAVHWAAACTTQVSQGPSHADGHAECDLPDSKAAVVNAWLKQDEARCIAEVHAGLEP